MLNPSLKYEILDCLESGPKTLAALENVICGPRADLYHAIAELRRSQVIAASTSVPREFSLVGSPG